MRFSDIELNVICKYIPSKLVSRSNHIFSMMVYTDIKCSLLKVPYIQNVKDVSNNVNFVWSTMAVN